MKKSEYDESLKKWEKEYLASLAISSNVTRGRGNTNQEPRYEGIYLRGSKELTEYLKAIKKNDKFKDLKNEQITMLALIKLATISEIK
jgi:hypothetical protein